MESGPAGSLSAQRRVAALRAQLCGGGRGAESGARHEGNILQGSGYGGGGSARGASLKGVVSAEEWELRCELAAAYRAVHMYGWDDTINNHLTARLPGSADHFLINCLGLGFDEVTASSLVAITGDGAVVRAGSHGDGINKAGFIIHGAIHQGAAANAHAHVVMHTHAADVVAVSADKRGLMPISQTALLVGEVSYHEFEGVAFSPSERARLLRDMRPASRVMMLRNHGILVHGPTLHQAFTTLFVAHKACEAQVRVQASGADINPVDPAVVVAMHNAAAKLGGPAPEDYCRAVVAHSKRQLVRAGLGGWDV